MALTPMDIHHKEFKTARFGGYNEEDVDSFLDIVADEFEKFVQENSDLKQQMEHLKKRLSEFEEMQTSLQSALLAASKSAEAVKEQARQESESLVSKAQEESDSTMRSAQEQARQMLLAAQNDRQKMECAIATLQEVKKRYLESIKKLADAHLQQVAEWESRNEAEGIVVETPVIEVPPPAPVTTPPASVEQAPQAQSQPAATPREATPAAPAEAMPAPRIEAASPPPPVEPMVAPPPMPPETRRGNEPPVAREMREVAPEVPVSPEVAERGEGQQKDVAPPSSNLVDEVLAMDSADESIFGDLEDDEGPEGREKGRKGRKEKRDKHFFWE